MDVLNGASKNVKFFETTPKTRCPKPRNHSGLGLVGISKNRQRRIFRDCQKNAAVHGIKEPRDSRGIDSTGMVFRGMQDFLPAFADFSRASPYDFTHVALTLPLGGAGGEVLGLLQTEHSGINFNPFVNASHTDAERHYFGKDHLGSVRAVTNQWGSPLYMFDYDVFGQPLQDRPERFRHGFTEKEFDSWTGLYNYGFRDYASLYGRFTTVDPIQDGLNWYAYVNSDPVNWLDPWGLKGQKSGEDPSRNAGENKNYLHIYVSKSWGTMYYEYTTNNPNCRTMMGSTEVITNVNKDSPDNKKASDTNRYQGNSTNPTQVKNGTYNIVEARVPSEKVNPDGRYGTGDQGLSLNITQKLPIARGEKKGELVDDRGYMIHITPLYYTDGCVGLYYDENDKESREAAETTMEVIVDIFKRIMSEDGNASITFYD